MIQLKDIYQKLVHFLERKETFSERKDLFDWYDQLHTSNSLDENTQKAIQENAKNKIFQTINSKKSAHTIRTITKWTSAAAIIIAISYWGYHKINPIADQIASKEMLARVEPAREKALIKLESGEEIDLDNIKLNQSIQMGNTIIKKDAKGKISYHNSKTGKIEVQMNTLSVPKASTFELKLSDGTLVKLNTDSKLTYPTSFDNNTRVVKLEGEGYFEVSKTSNHNRFIVESKDQKIQVLGTKFNIKVYPNDTKSLTTLAEGSVRVEKTNSSISALLKPGQQSLVNHSNHIDTKNVNLDDELSWVQNQFYFNGNNTAEVFQEVARWYNIEIQFNRKTSSEDYSGKIPRNLSLDKLIELLKYAEFNVKALVQKNKQIKLIIT